MEPNYDQQTGGAWSQLYGNPNWVLNLPDQYDWLNDSTLSIPGVGDLAGSNVAVPLTLPDWASGYGSPRAFADVWGPLYGNDPIGATGLLANFADQAGKQSAYDDRFNTAIESLTSLQGTIEELLRPVMDRLSADADGASQDPFRQQVLGELSRRADPGYSVVSPQERNAAHAQIGQQVAQARAIEQANNAARGITPSGYSVQRDQDLLSRGYAQTSAYDANLNAINEQAQQAALGALGQTNLQFNEQDLRRLGSLAGVGGQLSGLLGGQATNLASVLTGYYEAPNDLMAPANLNWALERLKEGDTAAVEEAGFDLADLASFVIELMALGPVQSFLGF